MKEINKKGFTLIELLVVIAIIALLVSILLPSLNKARDLAKNVTCMSTVRNAYLGFTYYTDEYEVYPLGTWGMNTHGHIWFKELCKGYLDDTKNFLTCPSQKKYLGGYVYDIDDYQIAYALNDYINGLKPENVNSPDKAWLMGEITYNNLWPAFLASGLATSQWGYYLYDYHMGKTNLLFVDGHQAAFSPDEVADGDIVDRAEE